MSSMDIVDSGGDVPPNQTIYVNRLNEKIKKDVLKKALYECFSQFGPVLDVVCMKTIKMRGQAFVVFKDVTAATNAVRQMQGFPFFEQEMNVTFAKSKSDCVAKLDGTYLPEKDGEGGEEGESKTVIMEEDAPTDPNKILFVQGLPKAFPKMALQMLFQQYPGLAEVRDVPGKDGIAFVEFGDEMQGTVAMNGLQGFKVTSDDHIRITYAKK